MMNKFTTKSEEETLLLGKRFASALSAGAAIFMLGDLGAGKTVFVRGVCGALGITSVRSPSFTIVNEYTQNAVIPIAHADLYRLDKAGGKSLALEEYVDDGFVLFVEWAQNGEIGIDDYVQIEINADDENTRTFTFTAAGPKSQAVLDAFFAKRDILLAVDCSLRWTNLALIDESGVRSEVNCDIGRRQAAEMPQIAEKLLNDTGVSRNEITHVGVTVGPGYFTGVRIGMAWGAAFAYAIGVKVVPIGTLNALFASVTDEGGPAVMMVYAGQGHVYAMSRGFENELEIAEYDVAEVLSWVERQGKNDVVLYSDDPKRISVPDSAAIKEIAPSAAAAAKIAWGIRQTAAIEPHELRANWCKDPLIL